MSKTTTELEKNTRVSICLALNKIFLIQEEITTVRMNTVEADYRDIWIAYKDKERWKNPIRAVFAFYETSRAELLASAIIYFHGVLPKISICYHSKTIEVASPGYLAGTGCV